MASLTHPGNRSLIETANYLTQSCLAPQAGERAVVITNPHPEVEGPARAFQEVLESLGVKVRFLIQTERDSNTPMDEAVTKELYDEPDLIVCLTFNKLGYDPQARQTPLQLGGKTFSHILQYLIFGKGSSRGFWSPNVRLDDLRQAALTDWEALRTEAARLKAILDQTEEVHVQNDVGTDLRFRTRGRLAFADDGNFRLPGRGGNMPAGEVFLSPENGTASGRLAIDGSMVFRDGSTLLESPLFLNFTDGYVDHIEGDLAHRLLQDLEIACREEKSETNRRNCRHLGEFGVGIFEGPALCGRVLVDEKKRGTCHLAIGSNYDGDAPAPIHYDGVLRYPTVDLTLNNGKTMRLLEAGAPLW